MLGIVSPIEETGKMNLLIINSSTVPQLVRGGLLRMCPFLHGRHSLVASVQKRIDLRRRNSLCLDPRETYNRGKEKCIFYVTTHGLMAGFPITNRCFPTAEARAPAPS